MSFYKVSRRIILCYLLLIVICNSGINSSPNVTAPLATSVHKTLYIDKAFLIEEIEIIQSAILEWERCTNKIATFTIKENFDSKNYSIIKENDAVVFLKFNENNLMIKYLDSYHKNHLLGFYRKNSPAALIGLIPERVSNKEYYRSLVLHEIGHAMNMDHIDKEYSIMYPLIDRNSIKLGEDDLYEFCKIYNCKVDILQSCTLSNK